jgi:hypothetical protein
MAGGRPYRLHGTRRHGVAAALALSAATHWWADRRINLKAFADAIGKGNFYTLGGPLCGAYAQYLLCTNLVAAESLRSEEPARLLVKESQVGDSV